jgi:hypothetical protein
MATKENQKKTEHTSISIQKRIRDRLNEARATGQSYSGIIEDLLDQVQN